MYDVHSRMYVYMHVYRSFNMLYFFTDTSRLKGAGRLNSVSECVYIFLFIYNIITTFMVITVIMTLVSNVACKKLCTCKSLINNNSIFFLYLVSLNAGPNP